MTNPLIDKAPVTHDRRSRARRVIDAEHNQLAQLLAQLPDAVLCFDHDWVIIFANAEAVRISRLSSSDLHTRTLWQLFPELIGTDLERTYRDVMQTRIPQQVEYFYKSFDLWVSVRAFPIDGGIALHYRDITAFKRTEALHSAKLLQFQQIFDASPDSIICIDRNWKCTFANRAARATFKADKLIGEDLWERFPSNQKEPYRSNYLATMERRVPTEFEAYYPKPLDIWFKVSARPYEDGIIIFSSDITDRKGAELLRDASARQLRRVLETTTDSIITIDRNWRFSFVNRRAAELLSPKGNLLGTNLWEKFPVAEQSPELVYHYLRAMDQGIAGEFEFFYPEDLNLWLSIQCRPFDDGIVVFFRDITERRKNEQDLVASEARYRVLADLNPQAIWMGAPDGGITYANQGFLDYIGLTIDTIGDNGWLNAFHTDDRARVLSAWSRSVATGAEYDIEARMVRARDSLVRWWWLRAQPVRDDSGKILHWLGVAIDIDDRKTFAETLQQRQEETERQRAELETVYQTAPIGLALFDPVEFRYLRLNERQAEIVGKPRDQIIGRTLTEIAPIDGLHEMFEQVAAGNPIRNHLLEGELPGRPGEYRYWNVNYFPVYNNDGAIQAITAVTLEITNQKKAEAALIQSEKLAAVGRLASSISHEINNPLEAITNLLYLIALSNELPDSVKAYVQTAQSELSRVCQIATQTLRFHRQAVRATDVNAADLVDAVLNLYQGRLANSNIRVEASYSSSSKILCFENDIRQVLNNLIANAIDAMRQGGRLVVRAHDAIDLAPGLSNSEVRPGIRITIADTGHGMSSTVRARLFEPFYTTKDLNGTGLGLWISSGIVKRHQGRLTFRSSQHPIHHGTVFSLFLPREEVTASEPQPPPPSANSPSANL
jgi:PAS domain S-box-containing protein